MWKMKKGIFIVTIFLIMVTTFAAASDWFPAPIINIIGKWSVDYQFYYSHELGAYTVYNGYFNYIGNFESFEFNNGGLAGICHDNDKSLAALYSNIAENEYHLYVLNAPRVSTIAFNSIGDNKILVTLTWAYSDNNDDYFILILSREKSKNEQETHDN
jgi:hypothetical protein